MALSRTNHGTSVAGTVASITSAAFTPADNSIIVLAVGCVRASGNTPWTPNNIVITDSIGGITWNLAVQVTGASGTWDSYVAYYWASIASGASMTVTATKTTGDSTYYRWLVHPVSYTGANAAPIGGTVASATGPSDGALSANLSSSPAATSEILAFLYGELTSNDVFADNGTSWTSLTNYNEAGEISYNSQYLTSPSGTEIRWEDVKNTSSTGAWITAATHYAAVEIKAAGGGGGGPVPIARRIFVMP